MSVLRASAKTALAWLLLSAFTAALAYGAGDLERGNALLRSGDFPGAAAVFKAVLAKEPSDRDARIGLARALAFGGDHPGGEREYRSVLDAHPGDVEARLGLADVLAWQKRYSGSLETLAALERERPDDIEVLIRKGRVAMWSGDQVTAARTFERVLALSPGNPEAVRGLASARPAPAPTLSHEVEGGLSLLRSGGINPGTQAWVAWRDKSRTRFDLLGRADYLHRFGKDEWRGTAGATRKWGGGQSLRIEAGISPGAEVFSRYAVEAELGWPLRRGLAGYLGGKFASFSAADVWNGVAALEYYPLPKDALLFRYVHSRTDFENAGNESNNTWLAKLTHFVTDDDRAWIYFSRGSESYTAATADQIGNLFSDIYGAGGRWFPDSRWGIEGNVERQDRNDGNRYLIVTAALHHRF